MLKFPSYRIKFVHPQLGTLTGEMRWSKEAGEDLFHPDEEFWPQLEEMGYEEELKGRGFFLDNAEISAL